MIKRLFGVFKDKSIEFLKWIVVECKDWHTILLLLVVSALLFTPVWGGYLLGFLFHWEWAIVIATGTFTLLLGPIPFWVLSISITLGIKRLFEKKQEHDALKRLEKRKKKEKLELIRKARPKSRYDKKDAKRKKARNT